jgi:hypothetical protein
MAVPNRAKGMPIICTAKDSLNSHINGTVTEEDGTGGGHFSLELTTIFGGQRVRFCSPENLGELESGEQASRS